MKKFIVFLLAGVIFAAPASARWHGYHRRGCCYASDVTAGIIGATAGVMLVNGMRPQRPKQPKPRVFVVEPEGKCYTIVSKKTGKITQKCVENASSDIIYVD